MKRRSTGLIEKNEYKINMIFVFILCNGRAVNSVTKSNESITSSKSTARVLNAGAILRVGVRSDVMGLLRVWHMLVLHHLA
jgi:hypothetical protein